MQHNTEAFQIKHGKMIQYMEISNEINKTSLILYTKVKIKWIKVAVFLTYFSL